MKKSKLVATFVAVLLIVSLCALCLYGCNDEGVGIEGKGVSRPEDIFTNDLDTTDSENLIANAHVTASSAADSVGKLQNSVCGRNIRQRQGRLQKLPYGRISAKQN